jgi:hypothetical protein
MQGQAGYKTMYLTKQTILETNNAISLSHAMRSGFVRHL